MRKIQKDFNQNKNKNKVKSTEVMMQKKDLNHFNNNNKSRFVEKKSDGEKEVIVMKPLITKKKENLTIEQRMKKSLEPKAKIRTLNYKNINKQINNMRIPKKGEPVKITNDGNMNNKKIRTVQNQNNQHKNGKQNHNTNKRKHNFDKISQTTNNGNNGSNGNNRNHKPSINGPSHKKRKLNHEYDTSFIEIRYIPNYINDNELKYILQDRYNVHIQSKDSLNMDDHNAMFKICRKLKLKNPEEKLMLSQLQNSHK